MLGVELNPLDWTTAQQAIAAIATLIVGWLQRSNLAWLVSAVRGEMAGGADGATGMVEVTAHVKALNAYAAAHQLDWSAHAEAILTDAAKVEAKSQ